MNLYIYCQPNDLSSAQMEALNQKFQAVIILNQPDFAPLFEDNEPKVVALDPDVVDWKFENETIDKIPNLKAICLETTGYEWVDCEYCAKKGIAVTNVPHYASNSVAEKCVMMALALAKKLPLFEKEGKMNWDTEFVGEDMFGKPTDIIGFGEIGHALAKKLDGLVGREEICYYSHRKDDPDYHYMDFDKMLEKSEYMFITLSKNKESLALFDDLSKFNPKTKVIIVANGFEDVAKRMAELVEAGKLGGVAFESDDLSKEYKGNVFVTPHNAYYTKESLEKMFEIWVNTMISATETPINRVN
ncbi:hypothetical protein IKX64_00695 [Candidatus Saccharibacteria bacterium]|nr:hypothetical protein [Candidatus Saccharibacteria bacterium]